MAFILHVDASGTPDFNCTGTVVSPNVVLTAGHCAVDETTGATLDPSGFGVETGSVDWTNAAQRQLSLVSKVIVNPAYNPFTDTFDAALLVLRTPTTATAIPLATDTYAPLEQPGAPAYIAGWGDTYTNGPTPFLLQWAPTVVQTAAYCSQFNPYFDASSELCTVDPPNYLTGACNGDSGGPLAAFNAADQLIEIGIITNGPADCNTYAADDFTAVIPLESWVASWIQAAAPPTPPPPVPPPTPAPTPAPSQPSPPPATSTLPTLTLAQAEGYVRQTLAGTLGQRFKPARGYTPICNRKSPTRFTCNIRFWHGPNDYHGTVTVYLVSGPGGLTEWTDNYTIHWINHYCLYHAANPYRCTTHTKRGSW
jgi:hypothetical protein